MKAKILLTKIILLSCSFCLSPNSTDDLIKASNECNLKALKIAINKKDLDIDKIEKSLKKTINNRCDGIYISKEILKYLKEKSKIFTPPPKKDMNVQYLLKMIKHMSNEAERAIYGSLYKKTIAYMATHGVDICENGDFLKKAVRSTSGLSEAESNILIRNGACFDLKVKDGNDLYQNNGYQGAVSQINGAYNLLFYSSKGNRGGMNNWIDWIKKANLFPDPIDANGTTPLMYAAKYGYKKEFKKLLQNGADITKKDKKGNSAIYYAYQNKIYKNDHTYTSDTLDKKIKDLSGIDFTGADFTDSDLTFTNLSSAKIGKCNFTNANMNYSIFGSNDLSTQTFNNTKMNFADLNNTKLSNIENCDLSYSKLIDKNLSNLSFKNSILKGTNLSKSTLENCNFENCIMDNSNLSNAITKNKTNFSGVSFNYANLTGVSFERKNSIYNKKTTFKNAILKGSNFSGQDTKNRNVISKMDFTEADFTGAQLNYVDIRNAKIPGCNFTNAKINETIWGKTDLTDITLHNTEMHGADLRNTKFKKLNYVDISRANIRGMNLTNFDFSNSIMNYVDATGSTFTNTNFENTSLNNATLRSKKRPSGGWAYSGKLESNWTSETSFENANLKNASLKSALLNRAIFKGANLYNADLTNADLKEANFYKVKSIKKTKFKNAKVTDNNNTLGANHGELKTIWTNGRTIDFRTEAILSMEGW
ncbi:hypothetical protein HN446_01390 [bacterium]|jgi:uncharacterized protein YjbI with pentapeptide repeats|nr:hypothetical protein [bacterium]